MKLFTALNNQLIKKKLQETYNDLEFVFEDLTYKDGVIEALKIRTVDVIIVSIDIQGSQNRFEFINQIRDINDTVKVIVVLAKQDREYENWLGSKGVYDVFIDSQFTFTELYEAIKREQKVIVKKEIEIQKEIQYIEKEKEIVRIKHVKEIRPVNFNRQIISVYNNAELAVELAYNIAKITNFNVLLINLDFSSSVDIYLNLSETRLQELTEENKGVFGLSGINTLIDSRILDVERFQCCCFPVKGCEKLSVLTELYSLDNFERFQKLDVYHLLEFAYRNYDVVFVTINKSIFNEHTRNVIQIAHINLVAIPVNVDSVREYSSYMYYFNDNFSVPLEKTWFIGWNYNSKCNLPISVFKDFVPGNYAGCLQRSEKRERFINVSSKFAKWSMKFFKKEYRDILSAFNIVPKRTLRDDINDFAKGVLRSLKAFKIKRKV